MHKTLFVLLFLMGATHCFAQTEDVAMAVATPNGSNIDANTQAILKSKILQIATAADGVAGTEVGGIIIVPEISTLNSKTVNAGMRNIHSVEISLTLTVRNIFTNTIFNTLQTTHLGEGYSAEEAVRTAISKIDAHSPAYTNFISTSKTKVLDYYTSNTSAIVAKAQTLAKQEQYDEALAFLSTYPASLKGYSTISKTISDIFNQYKTDNCNQLLMMARSAYAEQNLEEAAELLAMIDAKSSCGDEAKRLQKAIRQANESLYQEQMAMERERMQSEERTTNAQINAIKDIATAYYKRQTSFIFW